jgi:hypothetical protein
MLSSNAQNGREQVLQGLEGQGAQQQEITATVKSSVRLFGERDDLTTVLTIIPKRFISICTRIRFGLLLC